MHEGTKELEDGLMDVADYKGYGSWLSGVNANGGPYQDLGGDYFDKLHPERTAKRLLHRLERLGLTVSVSPAQALNPGFQES